jgi:hypothetical protein
MPEDTIMISGRLHGPDLAALHRQFLRDLKRIPSSNMSQLFQLFSP